MVYDLIIIGGGPAGVSAGVYAARKKINTLFITKDFSGQFFVAKKIENWIGTPEISGVELAKKLENHLKKYSSNIKINEGEIARKIRKVDNYFEVETQKGKYQAKAIIIATGSRRRKLNILGEKKFEGKGVSYCSTCDAPLFKNKNVVVVGGGNAGLEAARDLLAYANKIYILELSDKLKADAVLVDKIKQSKKVEFIFNSKAIEIKGEKFVKELVYENLKEDQKKSLQVDGVFVEIGSLPNSDLVADLVELNNKKEIVINQKTCETSVSGIFAAGDVTDVLYKQNNISVGDGIKALLSAHEYLKKIK